MISRKLSPFGCEITGFDAATVRSDDRDVILLLLADCGVLVIRDQHVDDRAFVRFLKCLGPIVFTKGETPIPDAPELNRVSNVGRQTPPKSVFHTDTSYVSQPPSITALRPVSVPRNGGETIFTDQYRAFDTLSDELKTFLRDAELKHCTTGVSLSGEDETFCYHPICRRHPISKCVALYLSTPERCTEIKGFDLQTGSDVIRSLFSHSTDMAHVYRHRWQPTDLLLWDNRCTLHRADHSKVAGERVLHSGMIADENPMAAG